MTISRRRRHGSRSQGHRGARVLAGLALALAAVGWSPAAASAETYYAAPAGTGSDCTQANPCSLEQAVETKALDSDEVVVLPGNYVLTGDALLISRQISVHGLSPQQRPRLSFDPSGPTDGIVAIVPAVLRDLEIVHLGSGQGLDAGWLTGERLYVSSENTGRTCNLNETLLLRDSVCVNHSSGDAITAAAFGSSVTQRLVNVTALAPNGVALRMSANSSGQITVNATNVIARGSAAVSDVRAQAFGAGNSVAINLDHSNYATTSTSGLGGTEEITPPGTNFNQTSSPLFQSGAGNFHQAAGSPTIDMGATNPTDGGVLDLDGEPRVQGPSQDIGADEFTVIASPGGGGGTTGATSTGAQGIADLLSAKTKGKKLLVRLRCDAAGGCTDNEIAIRSAKKIDLAAITAKRKRILLAKGTASLAGGETKTVRLKLRKQGRRLLAARRRLSAKATITAAGVDSTTKLKLKRK